MEFDRGANRHIFRIMHKTIDMSISFAYLSYEKRMEMGLVCYHGLCHSRYRPYHRLSSGSVFTCPEALGPALTRKLLVTTNRY